MSKKKQDVEAAPQWFKALSGSAGGIVEALCLQPLDTAKTRIQLDTNGKYRGVYRTTSLIIKEEGPKALYKGLTPFVAHLTLKYGLRLYSFGLFQKLLTLDKSTMTPMKNFTAGMLAGITEAIIIVTPFEVVKMRLQKQIGFEASKIKYKGPIDCVFKIVKEEGASAIMKGVVPTMFRNGSNQAFNFFAVNFINENIWDKKIGDHKELPVYQTILSGLVGGSLGPIANCPADVIKTRLQCQETIIKGEIKPKYNGFIQTMVVIAKEEGVLALWKGLSLRLMRVAPGQAIMWTVISRLEGLWDRNH